MVLVAGKSPSWMARMVTRMTPITNPGMESPTMAPIWTTLSTQPRLTAAATPISAAQMAIRIIAVKTMVMVTGMRVARELATGSEVNQEAPRLPVRASPTQAK